MCGTFSVWCTADGPKILSKTKTKARSNIKFNLILSCEEAPELLRDPSDFNAALNMSIGKSTMNFDGDKIQILKVARHVTNKL